MIEIEKQAEAAKLLKEKSEFLKEENGVKIYQYPQRKFTYDEELKAKTFLVIGMTGVGKTTLLNSMINYIAGVKLEDDYRFHLVTESLRDGSQAHSQTDEVTMYKIGGLNGFPPINIIDTPGFGDTRGPEQDAKISVLIEDFFKNKIGAEIHGVLFVVKSTDARLQPQQKYVFN